MPLWKLSPLWMKLWKLWITPGRRRFHPTPLGRGESGGRPFSVGGRDPRWSLHAPQRRASIDGVSFPDVPTVTVADVPPIGPEVVLLDVHKAGERDLGHDGDASAKIC